MRTKVVYVLVSSENDIYLEQAYVSMFSLKYYMPEANIVLITDQQTSETFKNVRKKEVRLADTIVVEELPKTLNAQQRSRQLKTRVRNLIDGDFLFVDCDTIITRRLDDIDEVEACIAACRDTHSNFIDNPYRNTCLRQGYKLGWPIDDEQDYFNSGVIYVKDVSETHEFYYRWNNNLNLGYPKRVWMDQPSFAKTNYEMGHIVQHLPDIWNCELKHGIRFLKESYIVHYLCTNPSRHQDQQLFLLNEKSVLMEIKKAGEISEDIMKVIEDPFKGLAEVTHCFAGEDVFFFRSGGYNFLRRHFHRDKRSVLLSLFQFVENINKKLNTLKLIICK